MGEFVAAVAVTAWLIALTAFDIRLRRLPNLLTLPGAVGIVAVAGFCGAGLAAFAGAASLFVGYAVVHVASPASLGAGDVKLALGVGALTGAFGVQAWLLCAFGASVLTGLLGLVAMMRGSRTALPHGPSMCLAAATAIVVTAL